MKHDYVGIDEDDFFVIGELPKAELAVVIFVVGIFRRSGIADAFDDSEIPTGFF